MRCCHEITIVNKIILWGGRTISGRRDPRARSTFFFYLNWHCVLVWLVCGSISGTLCSILCWTLLGEQFQRENKNDLIPINRIQQNGTWSRIIIASHHQHSTMQRVNHSLNFFILLNIYVYIYIYYIFNNYMQKIKAALLFLLCSFFWFGCFFLLVCLCLFFILNLNSLETKFSLWNYEVREVIPIKWLFDSIKFICFGFVKIDFFSFLFVFPRFICQKKHDIYCLMCLLLFYWTAMIEIDVEYCHSWESHYMQWFIISLIYFIASRATKN